MPQNPIDHRPRFDQREGRAGRGRKRIEAAVPGFSDKEYLKYLARQLSISAAALAERQEQNSCLEGELAWFRERMRSPRHRVAEAAAHAIQKIPVVWPAIAALTDFFLRRQERTTPKNKQLV
jgi:hypothetical protein